MECGGNTGLVEQTATGCGSYQADSTDGGDGLTWSCVFSVSVLGLAQLVTVTQDERFLIVKQGDSVKLHCSYTGSGFYSMLWYQEKEEQGLKLMVLSGDTKPGDMEDGFREWTLDRPNMQSSSLSLQQVKAQHSAVYFCAVSEHSKK
ncbi:hypothetical protein GDO86_019413, partial [Hymenochirus boettgeri]